jgi:hypothetical protein
MARPKKETALAPAPKPLQLSLIDDLAVDVGAGMENATADSFAIPFLNVLQKGSPQVDRASGMAIKGAAEGQIFESVTGRMFDGEKGVLIVPCAYRRVFIHWGARGADGGFKGELSADMVATMRSQGRIVESDGRLFMPLPDGTVNDKKCDRVSDTRNHFVLLLDDDGGYTQALISLTSTQIKKSKVLMSALASVKINIAGRGPVTPATFANKVRMTTVPEQNDKGTWFGVRFELDGLLTDKAVYAAAKAFYESVSQGQIQTKYEDNPAAAASGF